MACFYLHHVCRQGIEKGISLFSLPNLNLYSIYIKKIHPLDMFILSLKALEKDSLQFDMSVEVTAKLISMCQEYSPTPGLT